MARVMLVEDNPDNRLLVRVLLEDRHDVHEFEDGASALAALADEVPDVVLLDISLPGMDGVEVLARMRSAGHETLPVIALTAHAMAGDEARFLAAGFNGYVSKPIVHEDALEGAIHEALGS